VLISFISNQILLLYATINEAGYIVEKINKFIAYFFAFKLIIKNDILNENKYSSKEKKEKEYSNKYSFE
jgi:hypothetical protein